MRSEKWASLNPRVGTKLNMDNTAWRGRVPSMGLVTPLVYRNPRNPRHVPRQGKSLRFIWPCQPHTICSSSATSVCVICLRDLTALRPCEARIFIQHPKWHSVVLQSSCGRHMEAWLSIHYLTLGLTPLPVVLLLICYNSPSGELSAFLLEKKV